MGGLDIKKRVNYKGIWYRIKIEQDYCFPIVNLYIFSDKWYSIFLRPLYILSFDYIEYDDKQNEMLNKELIEKFNTIDFVKTAFDEYFRQLQKNMTKKDLLKNFFLRIKNELKYWDGVIE